MLGCCKGNLLIQNDTIAKLQGLNEEKEMQELCQNFSDKLYGGCECYIHVFMLFFCFFFKCALKSITDLQRIVFFLPSKEDTQMIVQ